MAREFSGVFATALATTDEFAAVVLTEDALAIEIAPTVNALDAFEIWAKMHSAGQFVKLAGAAADYTTPKGIVKAASGDPTTLASGGVAVILSATRPVVALQPEAAGL